MAHKKPPAISAKTAPPIGRPFQPGQSGNPSGRPRRSSVREFFEAPLNDGGTRMEHVLVALYQTATDRKHRDHMRAVELSAAYFAGKPTDFVEVSGEVTGQVDLRSLTTERLNQRINDLLARVKARQGRVDRDDNE
jgi:hypothetical protein